MNRRGFLKLMAGAAALPVVAALPAARREYDLVSSAKPLFPALEPIAAGAITAEMINAGLTGTSIMARQEAAAVFAEHLYSQVQAAVGWQQRRNATLTALLDKVADVYP